jgi:hypothetical protein
VAIAIKKNCLRLISTPKMEQDNCAKLAQIGSQPASPFRIKTEKLDPSICFPSPPKADIASGPLSADTVAKVENPTMPKIW